MMFRCSQFGRLLTVGALVASLIVSGCFTRRTGIGIAPPKVYPDAVARQTLGNQSNEMMKAARGVDPSRLNQYATGRQAIEVSAQASYSQSGAAMPFATPLAAPAIPTLPSLAGPTPDSLGGLFVDSLDDITAKEANIEAARLLYQADTTLLGRDARLYLVRFDISLEPVRQSRWTYPFRWADCIHFRLDDFPDWDCTGWQNYTKDYQAVVHFALPEPVGNEPQPVSAAPIQVYAVQPENQNLTALDSYAWANQLALAGTFAEAAAAVQADYQNRMEEQFAEQRKYPLIRGIIDSPTRFHFVFNPRRRVVRRSMLVSWIPGMGRYKTKLLLEPGVRRIYAYLVIPDPEGIEKKSGCNPVTAPADPYLRATVGTKSIQNFFGTKVQNAQDETVPVKVGTCRAKLKTIPPGGHAVQADVAITARYRQIDAPTRSDPLFFDSDSFPPKCGNGGESERYDLGTRLVELAIPLETSRRYLGSWTVNRVTGSEPSNVISLAYAPCRRCSSQDSTATDREFADQGTVADGQRSGCCDEPAATEETRGTVDYRSVRGLSYVKRHGEGSFIASDQGLRWLGASGSGVSGKGIFAIEPLPEKPDKGASLEIQFFVESGSRAGWSSVHEYNGPWRESQKKVEDLATQKGKAGTELVIKVPKLLSGQKLVQIHSISFGDDDARVVKIDGTPNDRYDVTVIVPKGDATTVELFAKADVDIVDDDPRMRNATKRESGKTVKFGLFEYGS